MLGMIVQMVTGKSYEDMVRQEIIDPLGLEDTGFGTHGMQADLTGYAPGLGASGDQPAAMSPTLSWSAGQMISTTKDLELFINAAINGELFEDPATLSLWKEQYYKPLFKAIPYGLGIMRWEFDGVGTVFGRDGQVFSAVALTAYDASTGNVCTAAVNNSQ